MKNLLLIFTFAILFWSCKGEKTENRETDNEEKYIEIIDNKTVYGLINSDELNSNRIFKFCENLLDRKTMFFIGEDTILLKKVDTLFSKKDKEFILKQYKNGLNFVLDQEQLKYKKVVEYDTTMVSEKQRRLFWDKTLEKYECISSISLPLFNLKKDIAIIQISYNCGVMCAEGGTFIYKLKNGKWKLYLTIDKWIS